MLITLSRVGVVFFIFLSSSRFTEIHVLPSPVSEANWRSLFRPGGLPPTLSKMASSFTGSAHSPLPGCNTVHNWLCSIIIDALYCRWFKCCIHIYNTYSRRVQTVLVINCQLNPFHRSKQFEFSFLYGMSLVTTHTKFLCPFFGWHLAALGGTLLQWLNAHGELPHGRLPTASRRCYCQSAWLYSWCPLC